ncbi:hypothetical protein D3C72_1271920 [compost metagenome]
MLHLGDVIRGVGIDRVEHALVDALQLQYLFRGGALGGRLGGVGLEQHAQLEGLVDVAVLPAKHHGAAPAFARHQAVRDQAFDGVAYGRAADGELACNVFFAQGFARQEGPCHQAATQFSVYKITGARHEGLPFLVLNTRLYQRRPAAWGAPLVWPRRLTSESKRANRRMVWRKA